MADNEANENTQDTETPNTQTDTENGNTQTDTENENTQTDTENEQADTEAEVFCQYCNKDLAHIKNQTENIRRHEEKCLREQKKVSRSQKKKRPVAAGGIRTFFSPVQKVPKFDLGEMDVSISVQSEEASLPSSQSDEFQSSHSSSVPVQSEEESLPSTRSDEFQSPYTSSVPVQSEEASLPSSQLDEFQSPYTSCGAGPQMSFCQGYKPALLGSIFDSFPFQLLKDRIDVVITDDVFHSRECLRNNHLLIYISNLAPPPMPAALI